MNEKTNIADSNDYREGSSNFEGRWNMRLLKKIGAGALAISATLGVYSHVNSTERQDDMQKTATVRIEEGSGKGRNQAGFEACKALGVPLESQDAVNGIGNRDSLRTPAATTRTYTEYAVSKADCETANSSVVLPPELRP